MNRKNTSKTKTVVLFLKYMIAFFSLLAIGFSVFLGLIFNALSNMPSDCDPSLPSQFETYVHVALPSNFDNFDSHCGGGFMSDGSSANFMIDPDDLNIFLQSTIIEPPLATSLPDYNRSRFAEHLNNSDSILYGYHSISGTYAQEIIVDTSDTNEWIVYFSVIVGG